MHRFRSKVRLFAWIASFAILMSAFGPAITRVLAATTGDPIALAQICGVDGQAVARAAGIDGQAPAHGDALPGGADCPYCLLHASVLAPPPAVASFALPPGPSAGPPARFLGSHAPLFAWIAAAPRGPPRIV